MFMKKIFPILALITLSLSALAQTGQKGTSVRTKYNFNGNWLSVGLYQYWWADAYGDTAEGME